MLDERLDEPVVLRQRARRADVVEARSGPLNLCLGELDGRDPALVGDMLGGEGAVGELRVEGNEGVFGVVQARIARAGEGVPARQAMPHSP